MTIPSMQKMFDKAVADYQDIEKKLRADLKTACFPTGDLNIINRIDGKIKHQFEIIEEVRKDKARPEDIKKQRIDICNYFIDELKDLKKELQQRINEYNTPEHQNFEFNRFITYCIKELSGSIGLALSTDEWAFLHLVSILNRNLKSYPKSKNLVNYGKALKLIYNQTSHNNELESFHINATNYKSPSYYLAYILSLCPSYPTNAGEFSKVNIKEMRISKKPIDILVLKNPYSRSSPFDYSPDLLKVFERRKILLGINSISKRDIMDLVFYYQATGRIPKMNRDKEKYYYGLHLENKSTEAKKKGKNTKKITFPYNARGEQNKDLLLDFNIPIGCL